MKKRQISIIIIALILGVVTAQADILKGRVVDADTGEPLQGAEVVFNETAIDMGSVMQTTIRTDSLGRFLKSESASRSATFHRTETNKTTIEL